MPLIEKHSRTLLGPQIMDWLVLRFKAFILQLGQPDRGVNRARALQNVLLFISALKLTDLSSNTACMQLKPQYLSNVYPHGTILSQLFRLLFNA